MAEVSKGKAKKTRKSKRARKSSATSPSQNLTLKKAKTFDLYESSDCESDLYLDAEDEEQTKVNTVLVGGQNMAENDGQPCGQSVMTKSIIEAFQNKDVKNSVMSALRNELRVSFREELKELKSELVQKNKIISKLESRIDVLENQVEGLEMYGRRNGVRIFGIPETEGENTDQIILKLVEDIDADIPPHALGRSHRVGPVDPRKPRAIIAKFVGHNFKTQLLRNKKKLRGRMGNKVFVNEDLTARRARWAKTARGWKRDGKIGDSWTRDGILFIKHRDGTINRVNSDNELTAVKLELFPSETIRKVVATGRKDGAYDVSTDDEGCD